MKQTNVFRFVHVRSPRPGATTSVPTLPSDDEADRAVAVELEKFARQTGSVDEAAVQIAESARKSPDYSATVHRAALGRRQAVDRAMSAGNANELRAQLSEAIGQELEKLRSARTAILRDLNAIQLAPRSAQELSSLIWLARLNRVVANWEDDEALMPAAATFAAARPVLGAEIAQTISRLSAESANGKAVDGAAVHLGQLKARLHELGSQLAILEGLRDGRLALLQRLDDTTEKLFAAEMGAATSESVANGKGHQDSTFRLLAAKLAEARQRALGKLHIRDPDVLTSRTLGPEDLAALPVLRGEPGSADGLTYELAERTIRSKMVQVIRELSAAARRAKERR